MNCPHCNATVERVALTVIGVAEFEVSAPAEFTLNVQTLRATQLLDGRAHIQTCHACGKEFEVFTRFGQVVLVCKREPMDGAR